MTRCARRLVSGSLAVLLRMLSADLIASMGLTSGLTLALAGLSAPAWAKRAAPAEISPIEHNGVRYAVEHYGVKMQRDQNGGFVDAYEIKTGRHLWGVRLYLIEYDINKERDSQDIFITSMRRDGNILLLEAENGVHYRLNVVTRLVSTGKSR